MATLNPAQALGKKIESFGVALPEYQIVLGSGFKNSIQDGVPPTFAKKGEFAFSDVPGLPTSTVPDHDGKFSVFEHAATKKTILVQMGRLHGYEGLAPSTVVQPVMIPRQLSVKTVFLTNAAGGMGDTHGPGDVMLITDHVNFTGKNPLEGPNPVGFDGQPLGPRFPDLSQVWNKELTTQLESALKAEKLTVHRGKYFGVLGPSFETPAEVQLFKSFGMGTVGMSTVWEAIALGHSGARVVGASLVSNLAAGLGGQKALDHFQIIETCRASAAQIMRGIFKTIEAEL